MDTLPPENEKFSFPVVIPTGHENSDQFEFGCVTTPGSPNSPADHLFCNGRLRPHVFPVVQRPSNYCSSLSRSASRASSISSRGSLVSSRSNSTNSRSSNCSSARTSTSAEASERRLCARRESNVTMNNSNNNKPALGSQRWQLIAAAPVLNHQGRSRSKAERKMSRKSRPIQEEEAPGGAKTPWFGRRILKSFVSACKECHAITT